MSNNSTSTVIKSAVIKNPVLFEAIGIAPVVAMATSLKTAIMLTAITVIQMTVIELVTCRFLKLLKSRFRVLVYAVLGVLINIPMFSLFSYFAPNETAKVSIFLPIIAVNSLIALHCERFAVRHGIKDTLIDALSSSFGYGLIVLLTGLIREIFGSGTVFGHDIALQIRLSGLLLPFGGFLVLGFVSALFKRVIKKSYPDEKPEAAFNLSEISQSHFDNIKNLFEEDFNPFDEDADAEAEIKNTFKFKRIEKSSRDNKPKKEKVKKVKKEKKSEKELLNKTESKEIPVDNSQKLFEEISSKEEIPVPVKENIMSDSKKYESEFDDLLSELELHKSKKEKDGDNK